MAFILFFAIGVVEMFIVTAWTKVVVNSQVVMSGIISFVNVAIWYYVLQEIVNNINNISIVFAYAIGCALGTMIGTYWIGRPPARRIAKARTADERIAAIEHGTAAIRA